MEASIRALAEPRRRRILELVRDEELTAGEIASAFEISRPAVSQHLTVLRHAGLLELRREGTKRLYRARAEGLVDVREFIESFWDGRLDRLRLAAEHEEGRRRSGSSAA
jgi:DNA-binding transcriptional ArsR family regulator